MEFIEQGFFTGERALYHSSGLSICDSTFCDGESPLKESRDIELKNCIFKWKYPLWYCRHIRVCGTIFLDMSRSGIWYTSDIEIVDSVIEAPKMFRRAEKIVLKNVSLPNAEETLWNCRTITLKDVQARGDYFGMNCVDVEAENFVLEGNYAFDGAKNVEIRNARMLSKDSFWNCENVTVYDSTIVGEYLGWNSKNITFVNCTIESTQGMCYMENVKMVRCRLLNTDRSFEFSSVDAEVMTKIDSVKNPISGKIAAKEIGEIILDDTLIDPSKTRIEEKKNGL